MAVDVSKLVGQTPDPEENERAMSEIPVDEELAKYTFLLGVDLLEEGGGMKVLQKAMQQSSDPIVVIAQFIVQLVAQLVEALQEETNFDPRVMLVRGGFVDSISDYIVKKLGLEQSQSDMIEQEVLEMIKGLAQGESKPAPQGQGVEAQAQSGAPVGPAGTAPAPAAAPAQLGVDQIAQREMQ